jgi:hypothetical protein
MSQIQAAEYVASYRVGLSTNVASGSDSDIGWRPRQVRSPLNSGHAALPRHVRFVPIGDISTLQTAARWARLLCVATELVHHCDP